MSSRRLLWSHCMRGAMFLEARGQLATRNPLGFQLPEACRTNDENLEEIRELF